MAELRTLFVHELDRMKQLKSKTQKSLEHVPDGSLRIGKSQGCVQYYHRLPGGKHNGIYIPKSEKDLIQRLAQKSYDEKILKCTEKRIAQFSKLLSDFEDNEIEQIFYNEHPERQNLIIPVEATYQQNLAKWKSISYDGKPFKEDSPIILTNNELRVRSKSEKIMADYFDSLGIVYKYECPLYLQPYGIIYPDFTFLSPHTGKEIYWEHEGMLDKEDYARNAVKKINLYESNNIYPGEQLILTFETSTSVINTNQLKRLTHKYLL